jgi:hypothetical protein
MRNGSILWGWSAAACAPQYQGRYEATLMRCEGDVDDAMTIPA